jgi:type I restriction enzyme S subunit
MTDDGLSFSECSYIDATEFEKARKLAACPEPGAVLFSKDGTVGKVHVVRHERPFAALSSIAILRPDASRLDSDFLGFALRTSAVFKDAANRKTGSALQRIILADLKKVGIPLPDLDQQRRIASQLEQADRLRRTRRYALELTDAFLPAVFLEIFGERHRATREYPTKILEDVVQPDRGITYGIVQAGPHIPDGVPYIKTGDIVDGVIDVDGLSRTTREIADSYQRSEVKFGDLVMSIRATVGTVAVLPEILDGANLTQGTARIAPSPEVNKLFLLWQIRMPEAQRWISQQIKGTTFLEITLGRLREMPVFVPPLALQQKFAAQVERVERLRNVQREALRQADHLFASLIDCTFSD